MHWADRKRIATTIDAPTSDPAVVRIWHITHGAALVVHGGRRWEVPAGSWLVLPGSVARQRLPAGTEVRSLGFAWRDVSGRVPLSELPPWVMPAARARACAQAVGALEQWVARHGSGWPTAAAPRSANRAPVSAAVYGHLQQRLFALLAVLLPAAPAGRPSVADTVAQRAQLMLQAHAAGAYPGTELLASRLGLGRRSLEQRFRAVTGQTLGAWHDRLRRDEACRLLSHGEPVLKTIAHQLGFAGVPAFRRWFRAATGRAPLAWRTHTLGL